MLMTVKIAIRNIFRNTRRSATTLATIAIGAVAMVVFGAYVTYIELGVETGAVQRTGHLQVFRNGYFAYGTGSPGAWGMADYQGVVDAIRNDKALKPLVAVVTPFQPLAGIAGNFAKDTSKTFFGTGFVPSDRDKMKAWDAYGTGSTGIKRSGMSDAEPTKGIVGVGLVRILGLCAETGLEGCPPTRKPATAAKDAGGGAVPSDLADLAAREQAADTTAVKDSALPTIDLLAGTASGAPNVVSLQIGRVEQQPFKELDDNYVGMNLALAQSLVYGRGEHQATGIIVQLRHTEDLAVARTRLSALFRELKLDLEVRDFTELNPQYLQIIGLFRSIFSFISVIIGIVVLFTVSNAMGMSVVERTDEIGTTRAMGVRRSGIRRQFLTEGSLLGVLGATAGIVLAYLTCIVVNNGGLTWTPPGSSGAVPLRLYIEGSWGLAGGVWLALAIAAAIAAFLPAHRAARMPVVDALRHV